MTHFQPLDPILIDGQPAIFLSYWPDRTLAKVRINRQTKSVLVSSIRPDRAALIEEAAEFSLSDRGEHYYASDIARAFCLTPDELRLVYDRRDELEMERKYPHARYCP